MLRCPGCPGVNTPLPPSGPCLKGQPLFIGEAPGKEEEKKKQVFIGRTGDEVNRHYLPLAGLSRAACTFTNAIKCLPVSSGGKLDLKLRTDRELLESCVAYHLESEIERIRPSILVPLGAFACRAIGDDIDLDLMHGFPVLTPRGLAFPMAHPARGLHEPKQMLNIRNDWQRLRKFLAGTLSLPMDPFADEGEVDYDLADLADIQGIDPGLPLSCDTESKRGGEPFCLTFSQHQGRARLILAGNDVNLAAFQKRIELQRGPILFHNWFYDWPVTERMGLRIPYQLVVDTMQRAYHLGNLPQGLKALAWREAGMEMTDFDDVVSPHSAYLCLQYLMEANRRTWVRPPEQLRREKDGSWKLYHPQSMGTKLKRFFTDLSNNPGKDVFDAWANWKGEHEEIEREMGAPWPGKCISHVPFDQALYYACRDADALLRVWSVIKRMAANVRHYSQEGWRK